MIIDFFAGTLVSIHLVMDFLFKVFLNDWGKKISEDATKSYASYIIFIILSVHPPKCMLKKAVIFLSSTSFSEN